MNENEREFNFENLLAAAIKIPGVKVDRDKFLTECFKNSDDIDAILRLGPVVNGCDREVLSKLANDLVLKRTVESSAMSFAAGMPGGLALGAAVPADVLQYFAVALRLAQELSYLYGAKNLWNDGEVDTELVSEQLVLYCGAMFGADGAAGAARLMASRLAADMSKRIPKQVLTNSFWYPVVTQVGKAVGVKISKSMVANGVAKLIPVVGGFVSGGVTFASMKPMGMKLAAIFDDAIFDYQRDELMEDLQTVEDICNSELPNESEKFAVLKSSLGGVITGFKDIGSEVSDFFKKNSACDAEFEEYEADDDEEDEIPFGGKNLVFDFAEDDEDVFMKIEKLSSLYGMGAITEEEFNAKKKELLKRI